MKIQENDEEVTFMKQKPSAFSGWFTYLSM